MERHIESRRYLTYFEAREILRKRLEESGGALTNPVQERTWDYLRVIGEGDANKARETVESLKKLGLEEYIAVQLVNMCPDEDGYVTLILEGQEGLSVTAELLGKIREVLSSFCSPKSQEGQA